MSTLHRIREFALVAALGLGALAGSATLACERPTVESRDAAVADLGGITVTAPRLPAMTVTASRADLRVADLGAMTVEATRIRTVASAQRAANRAFN